MNRKVQVYIFRETTPRRFLLLKYSERKGGYWQPITGSVADGETLAEAVCREAEEETGIACAPSDIIFADYEFEFESYGRRHRESVFGVRATDEKVKLSAEHTAYAWLTFEECLDMIRWETNKEGLKKLVNRLKDERSEHYA